MNVGDKETTQIFNFPFFKAGTFNGHTYATSDLQKIESNFYALREVVKPPLKLGHGEQKFLKEEGMPAAGWVNAVRVVGGDRLVADIVDIPIRIFDLLKKKAYKRPSAEIYKDFHNEEGKSFGPVLAGLALLGADVPAVKTLPGIENLYSEVEEMMNVYNENFERNAMLTFEFKTEIEGEKGDENEEDEKKGIIQTEEVLDLNDVKIEM